MTRRASAETVAQSKRRRDEERAAIYKRIDERVPQPPDDASSGDAWRLEKLANAGVEIASCLTDDFLQETRRCSAASRRLREASADFWRAWRLAFRPYHQQPATGGDRLVEFTLREVPQNGRGN